MAQFILIPLLATLVLAALPAIALGDDKILLSEYVYVQHVLDDNKPEKIWPSANDQSMKNSESARKLDGLTYFHDMKQRGISPQAAARAPDAQALNNIAPAAGNPPPQIQLNNTSRPLQPSQSTKYVPVYNLDTGVNRGLEGKMVIDATAQNQ